MEIRGRVALVDGWESPVAEAICIPSISQDQLVKKNRSESSDLYGQMVVFWAWNIRSISDLSTTATFVSTFSNTCFLLLLIGFGSMNTTCAPVSSKQLKTKEQNDIVL